MGLGSVSGALVVSILDVELGMTMMSNCGSKVPCQDEPVRDKQRGRIIDCDALHGWEIWNHTEEFCLVYSRNRQSKRLPRYNVFIHQSPALNTVCDCLPTKTVPPIAELHVDMMTREFYVGREGQ